MAQHYSDPRRADNPHALPDIETFRLTSRDAARMRARMGEDGDEEDAWETGWYYWYCFPGCMPDSDPVGPFETEDAALADAREGMDDDEGDD